MPKKNKIVKEETVEMKDPEKKEPSIHEELVEINAILKEMLELLKDIEYNTHDRTGFLKRKEITMIKRILHSTVKRNTITKLTISFRGRTNYGCYS